MIGNHLSGIILSVHNNYIAGFIFFLVPFVLTQFMLNLGIYSIFCATVHHDLQIHGREPGWTYHALHDRFHDSVLYPAGDSGCTADDGRW